MFKFIRNWVKAIDASANALMELSTIRCYDDYNVHNRCALYRKTRLLVLMDRDATGRN